jgi:micrococcal nuclease
MRRTAIPALFHLLLLLLILAPGQGLCFSARLERAIDGDSLILALQDGHREEVRLIGLDTPELEQEWGQAAREYSRTFCSGGRLEVALDKEQRDHYGRLLAYVWRDGKMLNEALLEAGLAVILPIKPNTVFARRFRAAQERAQAGQQGFWAQGGLKLSPSRFRKLHPRK